MSQEKRVSLPGVGMAVLPPLLAAVAVGAWRRRWIDPLVDSGRELITPVRLLRGARPYGDFYYPYGAMGAYLRAAAIALFGRRLLVYEALDFAAAMVLFGLLARATRRAGGTLAAFLAASWAAAHCTVALGGGGFIFPYCFENLIALIGALLAISEAAAPAPSFPWLGAAGASLVLLSRPEIGVGMAAILAAAALRSPAGSQRKRILSMTAAGVVLAAPAWAWWTRGVPLDVLRKRGPLISTALSGPIAHFYRSLSGLADPKGSLLRWGTSAIIDTAVVVGALILGPWGRRRRRIRFFDVAGGIILAFLLFLFGAPVEGPVPSAPPFLFPFVLVAGAAALAALRRPLAETGQTARFLLFATASLFGARVVFGLTPPYLPSAYSSLAVPTLAATACVLLLGVLPSRLPDGPGARCRLAALMGLLIAVPYAHLLYTSFHVPAFPLATPEGTIRLPADRAGAIGGALRYLAERSRPGDGLTAFPESGFFNFATGLRNPLGIEDFTPATAANLPPVVFEALPRGTPRFVVLVNRPSAEFGRQWSAFGTDYDRRLWAQIRERYRPAARFGDAAPDAPIGPGPFFVRIYERARAPHP